MEKLRKMFVVSVMFTTVLAMSVVAVPEVGAAASAGDLIKMDGLSSVYYLGADGKRYVFPNEQTYFSWYSDFSGVVTIPQSELESYPLGANVTVRPGTKLVKITTNPKVYAVEADGTLIGVPSETVAASLYGANWAQRVIDVPDAFFTNYTISSEEVSASAYPQGSLVKFSGSEDVYVINADGTASKIASEAAFAANRFSWDNVLDAPESMTVPTLGSEIAGADADIIDTSSGAGGTAGAGTGLTVALSGATSAASVLVTGQAIANLGSFNFTASNDGDVKITTLQLKRLGVSADATLAAIYLYDGVNRLTDAASVSSGLITWNTASGIFAVPAGTTKTITVKSNIATNTSGQTVGVGIESASGITTNGASVSGSYPINSNIHSIATATLADVNFNNTTDPATDGAPSPQDEFKLWSNSVVISTRAADLSYITFRQIGSVATADLANFKLFIAGVQVGETVAAMDANGYITFDLTDSPYRLETGTKEFKVLVDIVGGSTRTTSLSLRQTSDVSIIDTEYNVPVLARANSTTFSARSSATQTIAGGVLTVTKKTDSPSGNVVNGASNVTLASYEFKATGEPIKVESLRAMVDSSENAVTELRNGKIFVNGSQVGSTADLAEVNTTATGTEYTGLNFTVTPGTPATVEIKADIYDSDGTNNVTATTTLKAQIYGSASLNNAQKTVSLGYTNVPSSTKDGNTLSVKQGALTLAKYTGYTNHSIVAPKTTYKLGEYRLTADTTEAVNITSFTVDFNNSTGDINSASDFSDVYVIYGSTTGTAKATVASTSDNTWNVSNLTLEAGQTISVAVYGDVESSIGSGAVIITRMQALGTTVSSGQSANSTNNVIGQSITIGTGTMTTAATEDPLDQIVYGGQTVTAANYELTAANDSYTVEEVCVKFLDANVVDVVNAVYLYDGDTLLNSGGTPLSGAYATTTGLTLSVPANTTKTITVKLGLNSIGTGAGTPGRNASTTLDTVVSRNSSGTQEYDSDDRQGNQLFVYKTYPVVSHVQLSSADRQIVNDSSQSVYQFTVTPSAGGSVALKQFALYTTWSDLGPTSVDNLKLTAFKLYRGTTDISSLVTIVDNTGANVKGAGGATSSTSTGVYVAWITEETVSSATTYTVKATPGNFDSGTTSSDSVTLNMLGDTAHNGSNQYVGDQDGNNIWGLGTSTKLTNTAYYFIWSDRSAVGHSSASSTDGSDGSTGDWANGYKVDYLDLSTTRLSM